MEHINLLGFLAPICHYICKLMCVMNESLFTLIAYLQCCRTLYWCMFCISWRINILNHKYKQSRFGYHRTPHLVPISDMAWNTRTVFKARTIVANVNYTFTSPWSDIHTYSGTLCKHGLYYHWHLIRWAATLPRRPSRSHWRHPEWSFWPPQVQPVTTKVADTAAPHVSPVIPYIQLNKVTKRTLYVNT